MANESQVAHIQRMNRWSVVRCRFSILQWCGRVGGLIGKVQSNMKGAVQRVQLCGG